MGTVILDQCCWVEAQRALTLSVRLHIKKWHTLARSHVNLTVNIIIKKNSNIQTWYITSPVAILHTVPPSDLIDFILFLDFICRDPSLCHKGLRLSCSSYWRAVSFFAYWHGQRCVNNSLPLHWEGALKATSHLPWLYWLGGGMFVWLWKTPSSFFPLWSSFSTCGWRLIRCCCIQDWRDLPLSRTVGVTPGNYPAFCYYRLLFTEY